MEERKINSNDLGVRRATVARLMFELGADKEFTLSELYGKYCDFLGENTNTYLGEGQHIRDYLEEMSESPFNVLVADPFSGTYKYSPELVKKIKEGKE